MARKKGKQSGNFASKSARATWHTTELHERVWEVRSEGNNRNQRIGYAASNSTSTTNSSGRPSSTGTDGGGRRQVLLGRLRGILSERLHDDRVEQRVFRRQRYNVNGTNIEEGVNNVGAANNGGTQQQQQQQQLLDDERLSRAQKKQQTNYDYSFEFQSAPSLQILAAQALATELHQYVQMLGVETMHSIMRTFSIDIISFISFCRYTQSRNLTADNDLVYSLGFHHHIGTLAINADDGLDNAGLLKLLPQAGTGVIADSWEDVLRPGQEYDDCFDNIDNGMIISGCIHLKQFMLSNARYVTVDGIVSFLKRCPCLRYLGLNNCLFHEEESGPELLLHRQICSKQFISGKIEFIDLSFCGWLTNSLLLIFLREELFPLVSSTFRTRSLPRIVTVYVVGCSNVTARAFKDYNFAGKIQIIGDADHRMKTLGQMMMQLSGVNGAYRFFGKAGVVKRSRVTTDKVRGRPRSRCTAPVSVSVNDVWY